jgi:hypothetical protein
VIGELMHYVVTKKGAVAKINKNSHEVDRVLVRNSKPEVESKCDRNVIKGTSIIFTVFGREGSNN